MHAASELFVASRPQVLVCDFEVTSAVAPAVWNIYTEFELFVIFLFLSCSNDSSSSSKEK